MQAILSSTSSWSARVRQLAAAGASLPPAYTCLGVLLLASAWLQPGLLSPALLLLMLRQAAPLGLVTVGQSLVMRCRSLDLSAGGVVAAVCYLATTEFTAWPPALNMLACLSVGAAVGAVNGVFVVVVRASAVIVTLAVSMILSGTVIALSQFQSPGEAPAALAAAARLRLGPVPATALLWIAVLLPLAVWMRASVFGRTVDAVGANPRAAGLSGLAHLQVVFAAHVVSGLLSAAAGLVILGLVGVGSTQLGADLALNSLAASILGGVAFGSGRGGLAGPAAAAFMLAFLFNFLTSLGLGEAGRLMFQGAIIGAAVLVHASRQASSSGH